MKYGVLLIPLLIASTTFGIEKQVSIATLAENYQEYNLAEHLTTQTRKAEALQFAKKKIKAALSPRLLQIVNYSFLALAGAGISIGGLVVGSGSTFLGVVSYGLYKEKMEGLAKLSGGIFGMLGFAAMIVGGVGCGIGLYNIPSYFPKEFKERQEAEVKYYRDFKKAIKNLSK